MSIPSFSKEDLYDNFDDAVLDRGNRCWQQGCVVAMNARQNQGVIESIVRGNMNNSYRTRIMIENDGGYIDISGDCNCPDGFNCKHVAATLYEHLRASPKLGEQQFQQSTKILSQIDPDFNMGGASADLARWSCAMSEIKKPKQDAVSKQQDGVLLYMLDFNDLNDQYCKMNLTLIMSRNLKKGGFGAPKNFNRDSHSQQQALTPEDLVLIGGLYTCGLKRHDTRYLGENKYELMYLTASTFQSILQTNRCVFEHHKNVPLKLGKEREIEFEWRTSFDGAYQLRAKLKAEEGECWFWKLGGDFWYFDKQANRCGPIKSTVHTPVLDSMLRMPEVTPDQFNWVRENIGKQKKALKNVVPMPPELKEETQKEVKAQPTLFVYYDQVTMQERYYSNHLEEFALVNLTFDYSGVLVDWADPRPIVYKQDGEHVFKISRNKEDEQKAIDRLHAEGLGLLANHLRPGTQLKSHSSCFVLHDTTIEPGEFAQATALKLQKDGYKIEYADNFDHLPVIEAEEEWYSELNEDSQYDWFGLELGVQVGDEKINLLPILQNFLKDLSADDLQYLKNKPANEKILLDLPDHKKRLSIEVGRVNNMISVLVELFNPKALDENGQLRLSNLQAARLEEIAKATGAANVRWLGGKRILELGERLRNFDGLKTVKPPKSFKGELRPYQQEGLNWLQFLREYDLAGILADDMGLGKTIQALAHILCEKNKKRLTKPCLVVAPTSLMFNWQSEAEKFAPSLKVAVVHGPDRKQYHKKLNQFDLILTTYPLLFRDKDVLLNQEYHLLILDEAQVIKNAKAKVTQVAIQLKANHRLCLTGTPMENHLGEMWSLFHFLIPGLLGDATQFKKMFRTPIEKHQDAERQRHLSKRIAPFLLRRTKSEVVKELPDKTEIIRHIEMEGNQVDLYETIRLSMHKKVRAVIADKGLNRSQIIVLDALLKLRQVCCDPRLLKVDAAKKAYGESAKLDHLMEMLPKLIDEGRRVLLFSQFTTMLKLIEEKLKELKIDYVKLTGSTTDRRTPVETFQKGKVPLFLISLKAGGVGLNLTAADTVIHYDPWWNPAVESQATDRAHRIGQEKPVFVYKLVMKNSVEDKILEMQANKKALMDGLFEQVNNKKKSGLSADDLVNLFEPIG